MKICNALLSFISGLMPSLNFITRRTSSPPCISVDVACVMGGVLSVEIMLNLPARGYGQEEVQPVLAIDASNGVPAVEPSKMCETLFISILLRKTEFALAFLIFSTMNSVPPLELAGILSLFVAHEIVHSSPVVGGVTVVRKFVRVDIPERLPASRVSNPVNLRNSGGLLMELIVVAIPTVLPPWKKAATNKAPITVIANNSIVVIISDTALLCRSFLTAKLFV